MSPMLARNRYTKLAPPKLKTEPYSLQRLEAKLKKSESSFQPIVNEAEVRRKQMEDALAYINALPEGERKLEMRVYNRQLARGQLYLRKEERIAQANKKKTTDLKKPRTLEDFQIDNDEFIEYRKFFLLPSKLRPLEDQKDYKHILLSDVLRAESKIPTKRQQ